METFSALLAFVRGIHRSPVNSPHKGQWCGALMFSLICVWINSWVNNREAGDWRRYRAHYDVIVILFQYELIPWLPNVIFGVMCLLAGIMVLFLPETLGRPLPQTIKEVENWTRTLTPEEKARYEAAKKAEKEKRKQMQKEVELDTIAEEKEAI